MPSLTALPSSIGSTRRSKSKKSASKPGKDVNIVIMGPTGAGKTAFINLLSGSSLQVGNGLQSCTNAIQHSKPFKLDGRTITLVDSPGFDDTTKSDSEILNIICDFLSSEYREGQQYNGIIYFHRITDNRMSGSALRNYQFFMQLCGKDALPNTALVTNMWNLIDPSVGTARETELKTKDLFFKPALDQKAALMRHDNTADSASRIVRYFLSKNPRPFLIQQELVEQNKRVYETAAGITLLRELAEESRQHQQEMEELEREMKEVMRQQDETSREELEEARQRLEEARARVVAEEMKIKQHVVPITQVNGQEGGAKQKKGLWVMLRKLFRRGG